MIRNVNLRVFTGLCIAHILLAAGCYSTAGLKMATPMSNTELSVQHHYSIPKSRSIHYFKPLDDPQLEQLISISLADSPTLKSAQARIVQAQQLANIANSSLWPSVGADGGIDQAYFPVHGKIPPTFPPLNINKATISDVGMKFNYELDFWGKNKENLASKINEAYAAEMERAQARLVLSNEVANAYYEMQNSRVQHQLAIENSRLLKQLADISLQRTKQGIQSNIPVNTALSNYQSALLSVDAYQQAEHQARDKLAVLMGKNPFTTHIESPPFRYLKKELTLPALIPANALARRPDIAAACALTQSAAHQINVAKAAFFPNINLRGLLSLPSIYFNKSFNIWLQNDNAAAAIDLPIFDAGARQANLSAHYAQFELTVNQYNQTILNALQEMSGQLALLEKLNKQINSQNQTLHTTQSNHQLFQDRYRQGIIDYSQLIEIKQTLIQQKAVLYQLQTQHKQAFIGLIVALGGEL